MEVSRVTSGVSPSIVGAARGAAVAREEAALDAMDNT